MGNFFEKNKTFLLCILSLVFTFWGTYVNMFDSSMFQTTLLSILGTYGVKSVGSKFADGYKSKHTKK